ncbi:MAG: hypothetical protein DCF20_10820 [Pseudanabaena sp.]|nr:MAG: hypothetical protein DCF20_10820 [Pseudanabaena sp.]
MQSDLDQIAQKYSTYTDYDYWLNRAACKILIPRLEGLKVLQMGCASGVITEQLIKIVGELHVVEGSSLYVQEMRDRFGSQVQIEVSYFEEFSPDQTYDAIVLEGALHILKNPAQILQKAQNWLTESGVLHITVPHSLSFHRRLGVKMGILQDPVTNSERGEFFAQQSHFTQANLTSLLVDNGWEIKEIFSYLIKPFSNQQMQKLELPETAIDALFELGREFPELANQIYVAVTRSFAP